MRGLEYDDATLLVRLWIELRDIVASQAADFREGRVKYLRQVNPMWQTLGRATLHAENKRDPQRPFAFPASHMLRLSLRSRVAHLPLAEALRTYAGAKERARLQALLPSVQRAADRSGLAAELPASGALFAPQAWTIG
jgi:non-specific serine/threonine protein kinase